jgi:hypothetical protein
VSTEAQAWPFIVARNATLDWRPILAPPFLIDAHADYLLVTETSGPGPELTKPSVTVVKSARAGTITIVYSSIPATTELLGRQPAEPLLDHFGRPLHVVEGLVLRGDHRALPSGLQPTLDRVRTETLRLLTAFWNEEDEAAPPAPSQPIPISTAAQRTAAPAPPHDEQQGPKRTGRMALPLLLVVVVALGAAVWWWWSARTA